ncbi:MAG: FlgD immunoglobulin-like domain containing protein [Candidatus Latescibacterota bacterium]
MSVTRFHFQDGAPAGGDGPGDGRLCPGETFLPVVEVATWSLEGIAGLRLEVRWPAAALQPQPGESAGLWSTEVALGPGGRARLTGKSLALAPRSAPGQRIPFTVALIDRAGGTTRWRQTVEVTVQADGLQAVRPNPFNGRVVIPFSLAGQGAVTLGIVAINGQRVRRLVHGWLASGLHEAAWDARDGEGRPVATGVYFWRLAADGRVTSARLVLVQ